MDIVSATVTKNMLGTLAISTEFTAIFPSLYVIQIVIDDEKSLDITDFKPSHNIFSFDYMLRDKC